MALGLAMGSHWDTGDGTNVGFQPDHIDKLIGWWDFTDSQTVFTGSIGSLSPATFYDGIKQVKNKGNSGTDNLGEFIRTDGDDLEPGAKTRYLVSINNPEGAINQYAVRANPDTGAGPKVFGSSRVNGFGGVVNGNVSGTSGTFSTATINNHNLTIFFAVRTRTADYTNINGNAQGDHFLGIGCKIADYSDSGPPYWPGFRVSLSKSGDDWQWKSPNLDASALSDTTTLDTNAKIADFGTGLSKGTAVWTITNDSGTNGIKMYRNFDTSDGSSTTITNSGVDEGLDFDMTDGWVSIGGYAVSKSFNGVYADNMAKVFIHEVLIFNKTLNNDEMQQIEDHFRAKYDPDGDW
tara:strand:+ start:1136 stop:2185 length:1050 start_codon:yes stop_codon:yes gene_type:complete